MNPQEIIMKKHQERENLRNVIAQWNANRLDLFELSEPNEELEFHGVMRFYFQDSGQKVATKCIRVASDATSIAVIETLIEKFRPDMRMLSIPEYALYEIHENGDERRLAVEEKPLLVQLNWHIDDREGRFLLRRIDDVTNMPSVSFQGENQSFRRKLSRREKKQLKKQEKLNKLKADPIIDENDAGVAEKLYTELPETSFTRSISNPEAVMRRRRQQKLERKLQQFRSKDGGPDTGGTLKIYGEALCRDVPYKTLLLSVRDSAHQVVKEMLNKYGLEKEQDAQQFCLVQVNTAVPVEQSDTINGGTNNREYILDDDECPLAILMNHPSSRGSIMFHVRRRPADYHPRKRKKKLQGKWSKGSDLNEYRYEDSSSYNLPFFLELNPDGSDITNGAPKRHLLRPNVTEVGSERPNGAANGQSQSLQLFGPNVQPRHCVVAHTDSIVTVTPCSRDAETYVNQQRIYETTILQNGAVVKFGRIHSFRFLDPNHDPDRSRQRHDSARQAMDYSYDRQSQRGDDSTATPARQSPGPSAQNYETTFDVDGNVETVSTSSLGNKDDARSQRSIASSNGNRLSSNYERYPRGTDPILPAVLEFREETEEAFIHAVVTDLDPAAPSFKLAPAYCLYLVARYRASTHYRPELTPTERAHRLTGLMARVAAIIHNVIQERYRDSKHLAFWTANASELLHFLKCDRHVSAFTLDAQDILAECVEVAFRGLVACLRADLAVAMPRFLAAAAAGEHVDDAESTGSVLHVLTVVMALLRRCRVNAALTIQLFSQLFHYINMWAFNKVVTSPSQGGPCYCTRAWGLRLKGKLAQLEVWAERQGLELAADCHLARIIQAAHFLQAPKYSPEDMATLSATCFKLNSVQLRTLLQRYQKAPEEPRVAHEHIELLVRVGENVADEVARSDGREPRLEEDSELQLPFLLPEDGYTCYLIRGVPDGLVEFLAPLSHAGLCRMAAQPTSGGLWTIYMQNGGRSPSAMSNRSGPFMMSSHDLQAPDLQVIKLNKSNNGMGLSIVAAKGAGQDRLGIYIKSVVKGGAADADGQLQAGDQLLKVDGQSLVGITQERAAEYLVRTGPVVTLEVAKQGAIYHGLATLLQQPSPVMARASSSRSRPKSELLPSSAATAQSLPSSTSMSSLRPPNAVHRPAYEERLVDWDAPPQGPRRMSERDLPSRLLTEQGHNGDSRRSLNTHAPITSSKSVPALNSGNGDLGPTTSTPSTSQKPHENFNPGYSRTSSTSSIPQQAQSQQARSKSSQNLTDPRSPQLPPNGLGSRQASNPTLHHGYPGQPQQMPGYPGQSQPMPGYPGQSQTMPGYPGQSQTMPGYPGQSQTMSSYPGQYPASNGPVNGQANGDGERFYQNLSVYRNQEIHNGYPNRGKLPSPQDESRSPSMQHLQQQQAKSLRGSQSSLVHRPTEPLPQRPASAYLPKEATSQGGFPAPNQPGGGFSPANQGSGPTRDMMRAEAKLQEMHEEVRRREARGQITPTQQQQQQQLRPQISGQRLPNASYPYSPTDANGHATFNGQRPPMPANAPPTAPKPARPQGQPEYRPQMAQIAEQYRPQSDQYRPPQAEPYRPQSEPYRPQMDQYRPQMEQYRPQIGQPGEQYRPTGQPEQYRPTGHPDQYRPPATQQPQNNEQYRSPAGDNRVGFPAAQFASSVDGRLREEAAHRDSPPPPPPPTATHPLYQGAGAGGKTPTGPANDIRYSAASGEAPRGGFYPASPSTPGGPPRQPFPFNNVASSPWEREEREKEMVRRREAARAWRDAQIAELVAAPSRTAQQEEQLRALRLEREFQRRAEEAQRLEEEEEAEEDQESVERVQGLLRMATATQNSPSKHPHIMQNGRSPMTGQPMGGQPAGNQRKPEDMRKEQEAARRRDDELRQQHHQQQMAHQQMLQQQIQQQQQQQLQIQQQQMLLQQQLKENVIAPAQQPPPPPQNPPPTSILSRPNNINNQYPAKPGNPSQLRLDNLVINGPASPTTPQYNGYNGYQPDKEGILKSPPTSPTESGAARLDTLLGVERNAPPPPERGSSFAVMSQTQGVLRSGGREGVGTATVKRVSFSDPNANQGSPPPQMPPQMEKIREDPNHFINEAELLLSSPKSPDGPFSGNTPGVIGAQEVYKDPRTRMLAAQQKLVQGRSGPLPEKLSFKEKMKMFAMETGEDGTPRDKEKMKMFAMETGEDGTPRDKVKISRAQRDIDNIGGPVSPNNNSN